MKTLSRDARGFVESVTRYIRSDRRAKQVLPRVQSLLTKVTNAAKKDRTARVASAVSLTESEKTSIARVIRHVLGHDVECYFTVEPDLLGGVKVQVADWVMDTSLASQLTILAKTLV